MCVNVALQIKQVTGEEAIMEDGRVVRLGTLTHVQSGDFIEVYADLAMNKLTPKEAKSIRAAQKKGGTFV